MIYKKQSKLNLPITVSIVLHALFLAFLSYNSWQYYVNSGSFDGESMNAIMIDPSAMTQEYQTEVQNQLSIANTQEENNIHAEQKKIKEAENERLKLIQQENQKAADEQKKQEEEVRKKTLQAKQQAEVAKRKAEQAKIEAEKQKKDAKMAKNEKAVKDILGGLTSSKPAAKKGVSSNEQAQYVSLVQNAISNKFSNPSKLYNGRTCLLKITINDDGLLLDVISNGGDPALCRDAIAATRQATIPKPPKSLYPRVRQMTIDFQPN